jgi:iron complex outermembrane receptor protein
VTAAGPDQGFPVADAVAAKQPIAAETVNAYQVGLKGQHGRSTAWSVALFDEKLHNFQAQSRDEFTRQNVLNNIGRVTTRGVETDLRARFGGRFAFNASGVYDRARIDEFPNASCFPAQTIALGCVDGKQDLSGQPLSGAPEWNVAVGGEYEHGFARGHRVVVAANWHWQSREIKSLLNDPQSTQDAYGILSYRAGVETARWKLTAFCVNALDKSYALTRGRQSEWNINPHGASAGPTTDAVKWTPGRDSARYFGLEFNLRY